MEGGGGENARLWRKGVWRVRGQSISDTSESPATRLFQVGIDVVSLARQVEGVVVLFL